jgi:hypothetical protein
MGKIKSKIADLWAVWDNRINFAVSIDQKPLMFINYGVNLTTLLAVLSIKIKYSFVVVIVAILLILLQAWLLSKTNLQKKFADKTANQNFAWLDHVKDTKEIKDKLIGPE